MKLVKLGFILLCKRACQGRVRAKLAKCDWGLLLLGSDMQKRSFLDLVGDHGWVLYYEYHLWVFETANISVDNLISCPPL